ncbi:MAG: aminotransferase class V-fold PLP-dependent enzyme [Flectobacillus sp.]|uniref:aminotransferase class V-fold PLP-dependent enzyme n=1 Tax=Flectobacillus sp. TaxID=50419 RepID=UPI003B990344
MLRRNFLQNLMLGTGGLSALPFASPATNQNLQRILGYAPQKDVTTDEDYWAQIQLAFSASPNLINMSNAGVSPQPIMVQDALTHYNKLSNEAPTYYMWRILDENREAVRGKLADLAGCLPDEIAINRNATEALDTIILGLELQKGDEVIMSLQDYPNMLHGWRQREKREGIVMKYVNHNPLPCEDNDLLVRRYVDLVTENTKIVHVTHMINWTGQILPVKAIAEAVKKKNPKIKVVVDAAHTFAQIAFKIPDLGCDYLGASLHKWLCAPFGTGLLWVKKEHIASLWTHTPSDNPLKDDIRKFEGLGTRSFPIEMAIGHAVNFHHTIGTERIQKRLQYLKNYLLTRCVDLPNFYTQTSLKSEFSGAIALIGFKGMTSGELHNHLMKKARIYTSPVTWENIVGVRVTPHIYTPIKDMDKVILTLQDIAKEHLKAISK